MFWLQSVSVIPPVCSFLQKGCSQAFFLQVQYILKKHQCQYIFCSKVSPQQKLFRFRNTGQLQFHLFHLKLTLLFLPVILWETAQDEGSNVPVAAAKWK